METQVLIAGAGPTGLALAAALAQNGIEVEIVDKNRNRSNQSKAMAVHAGTLEVLERVFGAPFVEQMIATGRKAQGAFFHLGKKPPVHFGLSGIPSKYNFILALSQGETERLLEEKLQQYQGRVTRSSELMGIEAKEGRVFSQVKAGKEVPYRSRYLVGCDGAHSVVRRLLGFSFEGEKYPGTFLLGDAHLDWPFDTGNVRVFYSPFGQCLCIPLTDKLHRVILVLREGTQDPTSEELELGEFQDLARKITSVPLQISNPTWLTRFNVHRRITNHMQLGSVFLAGDAAHIHSPVGGQGMNTGIQDALNLAFKLTRVLRNEAPADLLDNYEKERLPVARRVLQGTNLATKTLLSHSGIAASIRENVFPFMIGQEWLRKLVLRVVSEVDVARREIRRMALV